MSSLHEEHGREAPKVLSGIIAGAVMRVPCPERFTFESIPGEPAMLVTDTQTGRYIDIGLCDVVGARKILDAFFGPKQRPTKRARAAKAAVGAR